MTKKFEDVRLLLMNSNLDCLCFNEFLLNASISDDQLTIDNYSCDGGSFKRGGGGNVIYTKDSHSWHMIHEWCMCTPDLECSWKL